MINEIDLRGSENRIDYGSWLRRIVGWDALLPLIISVTSVAIARVLKHQPPADILVLVGLPTMAFSLRLVVGYQQIKENSCRYLVRFFQFWAFLLALFSLAIIDFFVALFAFVPAANGPVPKDVETIWAMALLVYFSSVLFAMYPGRTRANTTASSNDLCTRD